MCTHRAARKLLFKGDYLGALAIAGPMLENNPGDIGAWRLTAQVLAGLGEQDAAIKNLRSLAEATADRGLPIVSISIIKEIAALGGPVDDLISNLATLYAEGSERVTVLEISPPPLPSFRPAVPWQGSGDQGNWIQRAQNAMAVAWGESMTLDGQKRPLPYVPILSALQPLEFKLFIDTLSRIQVPEGDVIVEQDAEGDAMYIIAEGEVDVVRRNPLGDDGVLAKLSAGAFFGEMALVSRAKRAAEVLAVEDTVILRAKRDEIEALAERSPEIGNVLIAFCHARMLENLMRISPVLSPVPAAKRPDVIGAFNTDYREAGAIIIEEGDKGQGLFLIVSGEVIVSKEEAGEDMLLANLGPGDVFGEISLLMQKPSTATVTASTNAAFLFLAAEDFLDLTKEFPELLKGAFDIALEREADNNSILGRPTITPDDSVLI